MSTFIDTVIETILVLSSTEKASIDEAFIDFTRPVRDEILKRCPHLAEVPPDAPLGKDTPLPLPSLISWDGLGTLIPVNPPSPETPVSDADNPAKQVANDTHPVEDEEPPVTWHDVALSIAAEFMGKIRHDIYTTLGYSTSAVSLLCLFVVCCVDIPQGISRNKFLAKVGIQAAHSSSTRLTVFSANSIVQETK